MFVVLCVLSRNSWTAEERLHKSGQVTMEMATRTPISNPQLLGLLLKNVVRRESKETGYVNSMFYPLNC